MRLREGLDDFSLKYATTNYPFVCVSSPLPVGMRVLPGWLFEMTPRSKKSIAAGGDGCWADGWCTRARVREFVQEYGVRTRKCEKNDTCGPTALLLY